MLGKEGNGRGGVWNLSLTSEGFGVVEVCLCGVRLIKPFGSSLRKEVEK
jgi:hypothetical protein